MAHSESEPKIGAGHAAAMWRQGLAELRAAIYPESNVAQSAQCGIYGTRTPGEVADARKADQDLDHNEEPSSVLSERLKDAERIRDDHEPKQRELDRD